MSTEARAPAIVNREPLAVEIAACRARIAIRADASVAHASGAA
jgi:hypothetical protein